MTVQATLIVSGEVQSVGYREYVYRQAVRLGLTGLVRNIDNNKVWIVCEGEPDKIEEFIRDIKVNDALAKVDIIDPFYGEARGCYDTFLVTRDLRFNGLPDAKLELGVEYLTKLLNSVDGIKDSINHMDTHLSDGFNGVNSSLEKVDNHISEGFKGMQSSIEKLDNHLPEGFSGVSSSLQKMDEHLSSDIKTMDAHLENMGSNTGHRFDRLDHKYGEFGKTLKGMASDIHAIRLAAVPPRRRIRKQVLRQARSRS
jgi:acylphosphatase